MNSFRTFLIRAVACYDNRLTPLILISVALLLIVISLSRISYPFDLGHFEACIWTPALLSAQGSNPYAYATQEPFVMAPYGYLYYLTVGLGFCLFGWQFWFGRTLTVLSAAVCVGCIVRLSRELTGRKRSMALAAMTFLTSLPLYHYIAVHRPDLPSLALGFSAVTLAFPAREASWRKTLLIVVLLVSAVYFKHTTILPVVVVIGRYLQTDRYRQALLVFLAVAVLSLTLAGALSLTSSGAYFWQHFVLMQQIPRSYSLSVKWLSSLLRSPATWIAAGVIATGVGKRVKKLPIGKPLPTLRERLARALKSPEVLFLVYLAAATTVAFVTSARSGSYINYYLEASIVLAIVVAMGWSWLAGSRNWRKSFPAIIGLFVFAAGIESWRMFRAESYRWRSLGYYQEVVETLKREVPPDRLVISVHPELATASGHRYHFGDFLQYLDGRSPKLQKIITDELSSKRYGAIIWLTRDDPKLAGYKSVAMKAPIHEKYYPVYLFVPK